MNSSKSSIWKSLYNSMHRTRKTISRSFLKNTVDENSLSLLEESLIKADVGYAITQEIITKAKENLAKNKFIEGATLAAFVKDLLVEYVSKPVSQNVETIKKPKIVLLAGINGAGKTTTIGKLAHHYQQQQLSCLIAAGDTFRAGAIEQVQAWGEANHIPVVAAKQGSDPGAVVYNAIASAIAKETDIVLIDTAGRLHTQDNLMAELAKIKKVIQKHDITAPHETLLVLDGSIGQNSIRQVEEFKQIIDINGIVMTKLDGSAKGGVVFKICQSHNIPIKYIGTGEAIDNLHIFDPKLFVDAIIDS